MVLSLLPFAGAFGLMFSIPASLTGRRIVSFWCDRLSHRVAGFTLLLYAAVHGGRRGSDGRLSRARERTVAYRLTFQNVGVLCCVVLGLGVFLSGDTGVTERDNYVPFALGVRGGDHGGGPDRYRSRAPCTATAAWFGGRNRAISSPRLPPRDDRTSMRNRRSFLVLSGTVLVYYVAYPSS